MTKIFVAFICLHVLLGCKTDNKNWDIVIEGVTSSSSPQVEDLNGDGIKDIVLGAGAVEWEKTERGVIAINGANGSILWFAKARNQIVGSAVFLDINHDKTPDVIIGGRSAELQAINGKNGEVIWEFYTKKHKFASIEDGWFNFFNPQIVLDQDNDQVADLLISNGGNALLPAGYKHRPTGKLLLISGKTGQILAEDLMPDGSETYFSPICFDCETSPNPTFLFGSGGETQKGHLYITSLDKLKQKALKSAIVLDSSATKGYISPPILADFTNDKVLDIVVNLVEGVTKLIDGKTLKVLWTVSCNNAEVYSQPAIGNFYGNDNTPDVLINYSIGTFPVYQKAKQWLIDGKTGKVVMNFEEKRFTYSSPLVADLNQDDIDEVILNTVNDSLVNSKSKPYYELTVFNFKANSKSFLAKRKSGACFASTPYLGDLDNDGKLDIIYNGNPTIISEFPGNTSYQTPELRLFIHRLELDNIPSKVVKWGNYLGNKQRSKVD